MLYNQYANSSNENTVFSEAKQTKCKFGNSDGIARSMAVTNEKS